MLSWRSLFNRSCFGVVAVGSRGWEEEEDDEEAVVEAWDSKREKRDKHKLIKWRSGREQQKEHKPSRVSSSCSSSSRPTSASSSVGV
jgi:hypothetical protein